MDTGMKIMVAGTEYPVTLGVSDHKFTVDLGGLGRLQAASFAELEKQARKVKVPFELPFIFVTQDGIRLGTVTGIHAGNGNVLIRWEDGTTEQQPRWSGGKYMPRQPAGDEARLRELMEARNAAQHALEEFTEPRFWQSLGIAATAARDAAAAAQDTDQETGDRS
jgi:hypothetical protein